MARQFYELHSLQESLKTSLTTIGWNLTDVRGGYQSQQDIAAGVVGVFYLPTRYIETQLGRSTSTGQSFERRVQFDAYMETEARASAIADDIMDYVDEFFIVVHKPDATPIANLYCANSETIESDVLTPRFSDVEVKNWRAVITATLRADYF
jgi:hypothetical protein